jgi:hypothetical protein
VSGGNGKAPPDQIAAAIARAEQPEQIAMRQWPVTIRSTGRPALVALPIDATDAEIAEVCGWILTAVMGTHRAERERPRSGILLPRPPQILRGPKE